MGNLSRTEKYKELRNKIHEDVDGGISSQELSRFEKRLNELDANNFAAPSEYTQENSFASHARGQVFTETNNMDTSLSRRDRQLDIDTLEQSENNTPSLDNDFIDQYIREVKQYNVEQGNALSENTSVNVLKQLRRQSDLPNEAPRVENNPGRPFPTQQQQTYQQQY